MMPSLYASDFFANPVWRVWKRAPRGVAALVAAAAITLTLAPNRARADEGGVSFWLPGLYGSLATAPQVPGWAVGIVNLYTPVSATGNVAAARQVTINNIPANISVSLNATLHASPDLVLVNPTYVFATPVLGGQFALSMAGAAGRSIASIDGTLTVATAGGLFAQRSGGIADARDGFSDLYPTASLRWNRGVDNFMIYGSGDVPVGTYNSSRLANLGIGHGAADGGFGYTYFDPKTGHEFSVVTGLTYNLVNQSTGYQNGIDWHLDWGASQFVSKQLQLGVVGYFYNQLTADSGCLPALCPFKSHTIGFGPQIGVILPNPSFQTYVNLKAYWDVDTQNRASGASAWVTIAFSPNAPTAEAPPAMTTKATLQH
jgi:hypothetical protein